MRETRQSGSEGGGDGVSSYPYHPEAAPEPASGVNPASRRENTHVSALLTAFGRRHKGTTARSKVKSDPETG